MTTPTPTETLPAPSAEIADGGAVPVCAKKKPGYKALLEYARCEEAYKAYMLTSGIDCGNIYLQWLPVMKRVFGKQKQSSSFWCAGGADQFRALLNKLRTDALAKATPTQAQSVATQTPTAPTAEGTLG